MLILVDLWGGTPFNQANGLIAGHEDKWAIVAGLKPANAHRCLRIPNDDGDSAEVAVQISGSGKEGVRIYPESLEPKTEAPAAQLQRQPTGSARRKEQYVGDGKIKIGLARIDSRLLTWSGGYNMDKDDKSRPYHRCIR